jgi:hypothetical protein
MSWLNEKHICTEILNALDDNTLSPIEELGVSEIEVLPINEIINRLDCIGIDYSFPEELKKKLGLSAPRQVSESPLADGNTNRNLIDRQRRLTSKHLFTRAAGFSAILLIVSAVGASVWFFAANTASDNLADWKQSKTYADKVQTDPGDVSIGGPIYGLPDDFDPPDPPTWTMSGVDQPFYALKTNPGDIGGSISDLVDISDLADTFSSPNLFFFEYNDVSLAQPFQLLDADYVGKGSNWAMMAAISLAWLGYFGYRRRA